MCCHGKYLLHDFVSSPSAWNKKKIHVFDIWLGLHHHLGSGHPQLVIRLVGHHLAPSTQLNSVLDWDAQVYLLPCQPLVMFSMGCRRQWCHALSMWGEWGRGEEIFPHPPKFIWDMLHVSQNTHTPNHLQNLPTWIKKYLFYHLSCKACGNRVFIVPVTYLRKQCICEYCSHRSVWWVIFSATVFVYWGKSTGFCLGYMSKSVITYL